MKKKLLLLFIVLFTLQSNAQIATSIISNDTRDNNYLPQDRNSGIYFDFKTNLADGLTDTNTYHGVMTFRPYGYSTDFSGGLSHQLAFTDYGNMWLRSGSNATWFSWTKIYSDKNINRLDVDFNANNIYANGNVGIGTTTPATKLDVVGSITLGSQNVNANTTKLFLKNPAGQTWALSSGVNMESENNFSIYNWSYNTQRSYFTILKEGNVGIGDSFPQAKLSIKEDGQTLAFITNKKLTGSWPPVTENTTMTIQSSGNSSGNLAFATGNSEGMRITNSGKVGIGTTNPDEKLTVKGKIHAEEIKVDLAVPADYVFQKYYTGKSNLKSDYVMPTLAEIENFTKKNHHLPNVSSAKEIQEKGLSLGEMSNVLLQKVEELTLYVIEQNKEIEHLKTDNNKQSIKIETVEKENEILKELSNRISKIENQLN